jgi:fatty acid desaturase
MSDEFISEARLRKLAVYNYLVLALWPVYLFLLPPIFAYSIWLALLYMIFPGLYIFTWVGYLMHESWHKYLPNVSNRFFYNAFALMLLSDPQLYNIVHSTHHGQVNTYEDAEFHPLGEIKSRMLRILTNWLEVVFGTAFLVMAANVTVPRNPLFAKKYRWWKLPASTLAWTVFFGGVGYFSHLVFHIGLGQVYLSFGLSFWLGSFFLHQSQLVEHGNLFVEGTFKERNLYTRNLKPVGLAEKIFLFLTHNDSREHVLHHTHTRLHTRPFPGTMPMPPEAVWITMGDYLRILGRMLVGK